MSGIYIHIPFCKKICYYCDFYFSLNLSIKTDYISALLQEIERRKDYLPNKKISTIYFGGGTPSVLSMGELQTIFNAISKIYDVSNVSEITLEANPDDLTPEYLQELRKTPINRLSIGIQSFRDEDLLMMNRRHSAVDALSCVGNAQNAGFKNITIDLMYGLPNLTLEAWQQNIQTALSLGVQHISAYHLTIEKQTAFNKFVNDGKIILPTEDISEEQYKVLVDMLLQHGFVHYEISNFALPGFESVHNSSYWKQIPYIGFGSSAHSFDGKSRQWNVSNNQKYISLLNNNELFFDHEHLTEKDRFNEYILTSLRTMWGVDIEYLKNIYGEKYCSIFMAKMDNYVLQGNAAKYDNSIVLTNKGMFISDAILADVFVSD